MIFRQPTESKGIPQSLTMEQPSRFVEPHPSSPLSPRPEEQSRPVIMQQLVHPMMMPYCWPMPTMSLMPMMGHYPIAMRYPNIPMQAQTFKSTTNATPRSMQMPMTYSRPYI